MKASTFGLAYGLLSMLAMSSNVNYSGGDSGYGTDPRQGWSESKMQDMAHQNALTRQRVNEYQLLKLGCKKFFYGKNYVVARNQKNADRKAKNGGLI